MTYQRPADTLLSPEALELERRAHYVLDHFGDGGISTGRYYQSDELFIRRSSTAFSALIIMLRGALSSVSNAKLAGVGYGVVLERLFDSRAVRVDENLVTRTLELLRQLMLLDDLSNV